MTVRLFNRVMDMMLLKDLMAKRNMDPIPDKDIPMFGFIIEDNETPVAIGFMRYCEGNCAIIDSIITNSDCSSYDRHEALDLFFTKIIGLAKCLNLTRIFGMTVDLGLTNRVKDLGFKEMNYRVMSLNLENNL